MNPQTLFCKSQTSLQIQELSLNPEEYLQIRKNILSRVTCASSQPASEFASPFCRIQNGGALCLLLDSCGSKVNLGDKFCFKCGSKVTEKSHPSERISAPVLFIYEVIIAILGLQTRKIARDISLTYKQQSRL